MENYTLAIETADSPGSVALLKNNQLIEQLFIEQQQDTSSLISAKIEEIVNRHLSSANEISQIAVGKGPGSYTGLRVSMSTAKGLAYALDIPLVPVCSLQAIAAGFIKQNQTISSHILVLLNARNENVFFALFDNNLNQIIEPQRGNLFEVIEKYSTDAVIISPQHIELEAIASTSIEKANQEAFFVGYASRNMNSKPLSTKDIAYLEPNYIINNYIKK